MLLILTLVAVGLVIVVHWRASAREASADGAATPCGSINVKGIQPGDWPAANYPEVGSRRF